MMCVCVCVCACVCVCVFLNCVVCEVFYSAEHDRVRVVRMRIRFARARQCFLAGKRVTLERSSRGERERFLCLSKRERRTAEARETECLFNCQCQKQGKQLTVL